MKISKKSTQVFQKKIYSYYRIHGRHDLPWRKTKDPYKILVSEIMLQQTQVKRVREYYKKFITTFPTLHILARAPLKKVLKLWSGLGYNRRALLLHRCAEEIFKKYGGKIPHDIETLKTLPGIGPYTAGAVMAFAHNQPVVMLETNIRAVFIHWFFRHHRVVFSPPFGASAREGISRHKRYVSDIPLLTSPSKGENKKNRASLGKINDREIIPLIEETIDRKHPREWYWALMDYGTMLKAQGENPSRQSAGYAKQSKFEGSQRQVRGRVVKILSASDTPVSLTRLRRLVRHSRVSQVVAQLVSEGMVRTERGKYQIA